eukprot:m.260053 g.260053  ORF g.260053 m.260053 type:complete len:474 (+) comp54593_c0_seq1:2142-3563(+)
MRKGPLLPRSMPMLAVWCAHAQIPPPTIHWFQQTLDHFNFQTEPQTFAQRYLVVNQHFKPGGPIMFYCGNEGVIWSFYNNTGFIFDIAPEFNALIVFAEHRYYGESLPFGNNSFVRQNLAYLSIEQALADYAQLLLVLRAEHGNAPVIAFGGSYGGMLSAAMRIKYPHIVDMALAASAPIRLGSQQVAPTRFFQTITNTFAAARSNCPDIIRAGFAQLYEAAAQGREGLQTLLLVFNLCEPLEADQVEHLVLWAVNSFTTLSMCDYPYAADFCAPLPGFPVKDACQHAARASSPLEALGYVARMGYNATGQTCNNIFTQYIECADQSGCGTGPSGIAWDYQACTEFMWQSETNNVTDMFPPRTWLYSDMIAYCNATFGIIPRPNWFLQEYGSGNISSSATRIIFSNGLLDPWHSGGFMKDLSPFLPSIVIEHGAHHLDLRFSNPEDPESVLIARELEVAYFRDWLAEIAARST